jgi:flagellar biosynthesis GTPase FlhF
VATDSSSQKPSKGVHTYRGRTLEDLLPRIHSELGPDAVILDERERLLDGVGGFSAQSFVEVDARRHDGPPAANSQQTASADLEPRAQPHHREPAVAEAPTLPVPETTESGGARVTAPTARRFETAVFMNRLRQASAVVPDDARDAPGVEQEAAEPAPDAEPEPELAPVPKPEPEQPAKPARAAPEAPAVTSPEPPIDPVRKRKAKAVTPAIRPRRRVRQRQEAILRSALVRLVEALRPNGPSKPAPAQPLDSAAADRVASDLSTRGASQTWTSQLISAAGAHGRPLAPDLLSAAEAEMARLIVRAPALPARGAAIAFVGAGGSGKTRCTAALASAYRRASTLTVTVLALDNKDGAGELRKLLREDDVPVLSLHGDKAQRAIQEARNGGLVIVDTGAVTPTDPVAVRALSAKLEPLGLDAVYITLPATLSPQAARRALASFGELNPSAVAITHADETDQLAVTVEIAVAHPIPLAYFHYGTDHRNALLVVDPAAVARQFLT